MLSTDDVKAFCDAIEESRPAHVCGKEVGHDFGTPFSREVPPVVIHQMNKMIGAIPGLKEVLLPGQMETGLGTKADHFVNMLGHQHRQGLPLLDWHRDANWEVMSFVYLVYKKNPADCAGLGQRHRHNKTSCYCCAPSDRNMGGRTFLSARPDGKIPVFAAKHGTSKRVMRSDLEMRATDVTMEKLVSTPGFQGQYWVYSASSNGWYLIPGHSLAHAVEQVALGLHRYTYVRFMRCKPTVKDPTSGHIFTTSKWLAKKRQEFLSGKVRDWCCPHCSLWCVGSQYHQRFGCTENRSSNARRSIFNSKARQAVGVASRRKRKR